jgi:hypothetical protein
MNLVLNDLAGGQDFLVFPGVLIGPVRGEAVARRQSHDLRVADPVPFLVASVDQDVAAFPVPDEDGGR